MLAAIPEHGPADASAPHSTAQALTDAHAIARSVVHDGSFSYGLCAERAGTAEPTIRGSPDARQEDHLMYIGVGTVVLILLIVLVVMALRGRRI
jgi:hypothetical protein